MSGEEDGRGVLGRLPADTPLVAGYAVVVGVLVLTGVVGGAVRVALAAPLILFLPGYALLSVLFPGDRPADADRPSVWRLPAVDGLGWFERCSLAVPTSVALGPLVAVSLAAVGVPLTTVTVTTTLVVLVLLATAAGALRRIQLSPETRYDVPIGRWREELRTRWGGDGTSRVDRGLDVLVAIAVVVAVSGLAVGFAAPDTGESYTEAALLTEGNDGLVAGNYPEAVQSGQQTELVLTLDNRLGADANYEVVVVLDRVRGSNTTASLTVLERSELSRVSLSVADGQQARRNLSVAPEMLGENLRLSVFVYRGEVPVNPSGATADEHLYLWIDVR